MKQIYVEDETQKKIKIEAAKQQKTMHEIVTEAIEKYLEGEVK